MNRKKPSRREILRATAAPGPGDGLDPRFDRPAGDGRVRNRKALQLCSQVAETLGAALVGELDDDVLRELYVASVVPAPNSNRLLVTLRPAIPGGSPDPGEVLARLAVHQSRLRAEVAAGIHRRRVPELTFQVAVR